MPNPARWIAPVVLLSLAACPAQGPRTPGPTGFPEPERTGKLLGIAADPSAWVARPEPAPPLAVTHKSPTTEVEGTAAITVTFNQPMIRLGPVESRDENPAAFPITVSPAVTAVYRWVAGDTLKVALTEPLRNAHSYTVTVPAGTRALSGAALKAPVTWTFTTPSPRVVRASLYPDARRRYDRILPDDGWALVFNLRVDPAALAPAVTVSAGGKAVAVDLSQLGDDPKAVLVKPRAPLPVDTAVLLRVAPGWRSPEGPVTCSTPFDQKSQGYRPLAVDARCDDATLGKDAVCWPMSNSHHEGLRLHFTEPVFKDDLLRHLRIDPPPPDLAKHLEAWGRTETVAGKTRSYGRTFVLKRDLQTRRAYRVTVTAGLPDIFGQKLARAYSDGFRTKGLPPGFFLPEDQEAFREAWKPYAIKAVNLTRVDLVQRVYRGAALVRFAECLRQETHSWADDCQKGVDGTKLALPARGGLDQVRDVTVPLPVGLVAMTFEAPEVVDSDQKRITMHRVAARTDIGLHGRLTPYGLTVWATGLRTGARLAGVAITVYDPKAAVIATGTTGPDGLLEVPRSAFGTRLDAPKPPLLYLVGQQRDDESYLRLDPVDGRWYGDHYRGDADLPDVGELAEYRAWEGDRPLRVGHVSTERGIYRPGRRVHVQGAARVYRSFQAAPMAGAKATVELRRDGIPLTAEKVTLSAHGAFFASLPLPAEGRTGYHEAVLLLDGETLSRTYFRVEEYREPRFEVTVTATPRRVRADGTVTLEAAGRYFFGGSMAGAGYRYSVQRSPRSLYLPGGRVRAGCGWELHRQGGAQWITSGGTLDGAGRARVTVDLTRQPRGFPCPAYQNVEVEVMSADRQTSANRTYVEQDPGDRYVTTEALASSPGIFRRRIAVVGTDLKTRYAGKVKATLYPLQRYSDVDFTRTLALKEVDVPAKGLNLEMTWPGHHAEWAAILVLSTRDEGGREAWTAERVTRPTAYQRKQEADQAQEEKRIAQLEVKLDKEDYLPGDTARVTVTRRGPRGEGRLFIERERIFRSVPLAFDAKGQAVIPVQVEPHFASSVSIRAVLLQEGTSLRGKQGPLATAQATLSVDAKPWRLHAGLRTDREVYRPGDRVKAQVAVADGLGKPRQAQVILVAVDEAVLRLTGFHLPDPFWSLFRTPSSSVVADDLRRHLARLGIDVEHQDWAAMRSGSGFGRGGIGSGGGGGGFGMGGRSASGSSGRKEEKPRRNFLTTAWQGSVVTGADGKAEVSFTLPDNLTQYRLMAMAVDGERSAGTGATQFRVDQPLLALPALPRVVRLGDRFEGGVVLYQAKAAAQAQVTAAVEGGAVTLSGPATKAVTLAQGKEEEVRFSFVARRPGAVKLTFGVKAGGLSDLVEHPLEVTDPALLEASAVSGETTSAVRQGIAPLGSLRPDRGGLEVSLSSTALTGVEDGLEQLIDYPYGCLEQTGSRVLALTVATVLGDRFGLRLPREPKVLLRRGVDRLLSLQRSDGGFGFWPGSSYGSVWGTAYALTVLHRVRLAAPAHGVVVPAEVVTRASRWLQQERARYSRTGYVGWQAWHWSYLVAILHALARSDQDVQKEALKAAEDRRHQPLFARALLLVTLKAGKRSAPADAVIAEMTTELGDSLRIEGQMAHAEENLSDGYQVLMHSSDRTTAMVLMALVESPTKHPMVPRIVRWLMSGRKQARFRNTQEAAWALMAAWDYARHWEKDVPDFEAGVWVGRGRVLSAFFKGREVKPQQSTTAMATLVKIAGATASDLVIGKRGTGTLYYVARLRYARRQLPTRGRDHGFAVKRSVEVLDAAGRPLKTQRAARLGDTVLVTLEVTSPEARQYVVIDDPLPAGMEGLDATLATGSRSFGEAMGWKGTDYYDHRELRDDRVLFFRDLKQPGTLTYRYLARVTAPGTFIRPPTKAEQMYEPEVFGHTAAERVTFLAR